MTHPIVIPQKSNQKEYLAETRERQLKSILKKTAVPA